jgi:hypothetical protein
MLPAWLACCVQALACASQYGKPIVKIEQKISTNSPKQRELRLKMRIFAAAQQKDWHS